jgi:hypothetical protein
VCVSRDALVPSGHPRAANETETIRPSTSVGLYNVTATVRFCGKPMAQTERSASSGVPRIEAEGGRGGRGEAGGGGVGGVKGVGGGDDPLPPSAEGAARRTIGASRGRR